LFALGANTVLAASQTYDDASASNVWDTSTLNWGGVAWSNGNDAVFAGTGEGVAVTTVTAHNVDFNSTGYSLTGSTITLNGSTPTLTTGTGVSASILSVLGGSAGMTKAGTGLLTLRGVNTYTGVTTINAGTLAFASGGSASTGGIINVNNGSTATAGLSITGGSVTGSLMIIAGVVGKPGAVNLDSGSLTLSGGGTPLLMGSDSSTNTATANAAFTQNGGAFTTNGNIFTGNSATSSQFFLSGGTFTESAGTTYLGIVNGGSGTLNVSNTAAVSLAALNLGYNAGSAGTVNVSGGSITVTAFSVIGGYNTGGTGIWSQTGGTATFQNNINLANSGNGTVSVSAGTFTQTTGTVYLGVAAGVTGTLNVSGTGTVALNQINFGYLSATSIATINLDGGTLAVKSLTGAGGGGVANGINTLNFNGGILRAAASFSTPGGVNYVVKNGGATVDTNSFNVTVGQVVAHGTGAATDSLAKTGSGNLTLTGANTYTGGTTVKAGKLLANNTSGSATGTSAVTVQSTATLGGTGAISGPVTLQSGATLAPGVTGIESLDIGALTVSAGATVATEINSSGSPTADVVNVTGNVSLGGTLTVTDIAATPATIVLGTKLTLVSYTGTVTGAFNGLGEGASFNVGSNTFKIRYADNQKVTLEAIAVPYDAWAASKGLTSINNGKTQDPDGDGFNNLMEFAFGTNPLSASSGAVSWTGGTVNSHGQPTTSVANIVNGVDFRAVFGRRKDYVAAGLTYTVQFSADLSVWVDSTDPVTVLASDSEIDVVSVPYPLFIEVNAQHDMKKPTYFRVNVTGP
jgi:autotransporter-associated beta strand protein